MAQARYRQYFEAEDASSPSADSAMEEPVIPMETQVTNLTRAMALVTVGHSDVMGMKHFVRFYEIPSNLTMVIYIKVIEVQDQVKTSLCLYFLNYILF